MNTTNLAHKFVFEEKNSLLKIFPTKDYLKVKLVTSKSKARMETVFVSILYARSGLGLDAVS